MKKDWMIKESELDQDQLQVLMHTIKKSCVITGCAGSGKSIIALVKAKRIQSIPTDQYNVVVYTRALCDYMNSGRIALGMSKDFLTKEKWSRLNNKSTDYLIVDEIQDFTEDEITNFINSTNKSFFFFGDSAQSIYKEYRDTIPVEDIRDLLSKENKPKYFELFRNYRLPLSIAKFSHLIINDDLSEFQDNIYQSKEISIPYLLKYDSIDHQIESIADIIKRKDITDAAILLPTGQLVQYVFNLLTKLGLNCEVRFTLKDRTWKDTLNFESELPKILTVHSAKGLQFESVFIPVLETYDYTKETTKNQLYVATTRTYRDLYLMYSDELPEVFSKIPTELYRSTESETITDI